MDADLLLRLLSLCVVLAGAETLHGIARTVWVVPRIGKERALKLSAVTGSLLAFGICLLLVPPMGLSGYGPHAVLGVVLAAFMVGFDLFIGHWVMRKPWHKLWPDFNPATGNYLSVGLAVLAAAPMAVHGLRPG
jgi:O-antigen/teichoic acid export membrane protein